MKQERLPLILLRDELEERERRELAPYASRSSESRGRRQPEPEHPYRSAFQRDRERVIHSTAFRRLQYKTQVFVNNEGDYYRTRLTHTIEASQIARTVARALRLNEDLAETIALAHDLGHTPFGHAGQDALAELMREHGGFEHNIQSLRIVDLLERRYAKFRGLNLTHEVREGIWKRRSPDDERAQALGFDKKLAPSLEAQIADCADSLAYDHHDVDDALKSGVIGESDLKGVELWQMALAAADERIAGAGAGADSDPRVRRREAIRFLIDLQVTDLVSTTRRRLEEGRIESPDDVRKATRPLVGLSPEVDARKHEFQEFLFKKVYRHYRMMRMAEKAKRFLSALFLEYVAHPQALPEEYQEWVHREGVHRGVCDYIAGMTDRYAQREYEKLFHPFETT
ncbi:deoxyguanosinetriphosphate triphosphohydrolase [bacterium]|nr:deoxyguanosinetriphosphate triphosphohydrolase [bacterium]